MNKTLEALLKANELKLLDMKLDEIEFALLEVENESTTN